MTSRPTARHCAVRVLGEVEKDPHCHAFERMHELSEAERLPKRDRRFLHELVAGVLRHRRTLDAIISAYSRVKLKDLERNIRQACRIGVYQLVYMDGVPAFAAVSSTVALAGKNQRARSFVNAVLRKIDSECRRVGVEKDRGGASPQKRLEIRAQKVCFFSRVVLPDPAADPVEHLAVLYSHPRSAVERWQRDFGEEQTERLLQAGNRVPPIFVRVNRRRGSAEACLEALHSDQISAQSSELEACLAISSPVSELIRSRPFRQGWCTIQDRTAMRVAPLLNPQPGERVLDACAAPGGKTSHLLELCPTDLEVVAVDRDQRRVDTMRETLSRLGAEEVQVRCADLLDSAVDLGQFDAVLVDAPCSNSGVFRRKPEARYRLDGNNLGSLTRRQDALLDAACERLKPGGRLVYSTCSIEKEENEGRVEALLNRRPQLRREEEWHAFPTDGGGDGGYACRLRAPRGTSR